MKTRPALVIINIFGFTSLLGGVVIFAIVIFTGTTDNSGFAGGLALVGLATTNASLVIIMKKLDAIEVALKKDRSAPIADLF
jgi:hypothetical protein